ncbi:YbaN family protein [Erwinia amylovora]|uniref:YbaN family protein n=1 Tax=Erwinia amylovora TaxID=552 RepID=UPI0021F390CC|nr:YbaN family protein [Erwinia amylovora]MCV6958983.1 YbaN family protein [Erwinia amylovora]MCZ2719534.1 YbaN family protein [Erwinia amylovora]MCZ2728894.1 YbaN family protein [Erwinia amylovora]UZB32450.1 YbaN family protein [Erwinia amylovora]UZB35778.1 YbaN family protein [Erwinia amylovora]
MTGRRNTLLPASAPEGNRKKLIRYLFQLLAIISLALAVAGFILPGLPCTEFVLLAAWFASRSSPSLHRWILRHRLFGPLLTNWQQGILPRRAKWAATLAMSITALIMVIFVTHKPGVVISICCMTAVLIWLWHRPEKLSPPA